MRLMRCFILVLLVMLCAVGASAQAPGPSAGGAPEPTSLDEAIVVVTIGDINGLLENVGALAGQISPLISMQMIKEQVGSVFNDPMLEGFPPGYGATLLIFPSSPEPIFIAYLEVSPSKIDSYLAALKTQGNDDAAKAEGLMILGDNASDLALGQKFAAQVKQKYLSGQGKPSLKATLNMDALVAFTEPLVLNTLLPLFALQSQMGGASGAPGQPTAEHMKSQMKIAEAEIRGLLNVSKQVKSMDIEILINQNGVRIEESIHAKTGSDLARFFEARSAPLAPLAALLSAKGAIRGVISYDNAALENLIRKEAEMLYKQMEIDATTRKTIEDWLDLTFKVYSGGYAFDLMTPGESLFGGSMIYTVKGEAEALNMMDSISEKMESFLKMYQDMGVPMTIDFQKNVRKHNGVDIHRFTMDMDLTSAGPQAVQMMQVMFGDKMKYDVAIIDKIMVYTMGDNKVEEMIDAIKNKSHPGNIPLKAQQVYGPKATAYIDIRVPELANVLVALVEKVQPGMGAQAAGVISTLQGADPITMAGFWGDGPSARFSTDIPTGLMIKVSQAAMMGYMMFQQQSFGAMGGQPPPPGGGGNPANPF